MNGLDQILIKVAGYYLIACPHYGNWLENWLELAGRLKKVDAN
jgi:hypothetical protein